MVTPHDSLRQSRRLALMVTVNALWPNSPSRLLHTQTFSVYVRVRPPVIVLKPEPNAPPPPSVSGVMPSWISTPIAYFLSFAAVIAAVVAVKQNLATIKGWFRQQ